MISLGYSHIKRKAEKKAKDKKKTDQSDSSHPGRKVDSDKAKNHQDDARAPLTGRKTEHLVDSRRRSSSVGNLSDLLAAPSGDSTNDGSRSASTSRKLTTIPRDQKESK